MAGRVRVCPWATTTCSWATTSPSLDTRNERTAPTLSPHEPTLLPAIYKRVGSTSKRVGCSFSLAALSRVDAWESERAVRLVGDERVINALGQPLDALEAVGTDERRAFERRRRRVLLLRTSHRQPAPST